MNSNPAARLQDVINQQVNNFRSSEIRASVEGASSRADLEQRIRGSVGNARRRINTEIDTIEQQLVQDIPNNDQERLDYLRIVIKPFEYAIQLIVDLVKTVFDSIVDFFKSLWNGIKNTFVWVQDKICDGLAWIGDKVIRGFKEVAGFFASIF